MPHDADISSIPLESIHKQEGFLYDDSHQWKKPVELLLGKQFKLEVLEDAVKMMKPGEVAVYLIHSKVSTWHTISLYFTAENIN